MSEPRDQAMTWLDDADVSMLDLVDHVLNKGVVLSGEIVLGIADVDLVCIRIAAALGAADRVLGSDDGPAHD